MEGEGSRGSEDQEAISLEAPQMNPALVGKPLEWGRLIVTFLLLPKEKKGEKDSITFLPQSHLCIQSLFPLGKKACPW